MKLALGRGELWRGMDTVLDAVPSKPTMPVLGNILLVADSDGLGLVTSDLDLSLRTWVVAAVETPGSITVPARLLADIIREWPEGEVTIEMRDHSVHLAGAIGSVDGGEGSYTLPAASADDFPKFPENLPGVTLELESGEGLSADSLCEMIQRTAFAVSRGDTRPVLNGELWRVDRDGILMIATDGHRFAHYRWQADLSDQIGSETREAIVPPPALAQMVKLLPQSTQRAKVTFGNAQLMVHLGSTQLITRLIEGPYVDYRPVIPTDNHKHLRVSTEQFLPAVRRVSTLSSAYTRHIHLALQPGMAVLSANSPELGGDAKEAIPVEYDGEAMEIGYNAQYLIEILRRMGADRVLFELANESTGTIMRPVEQGEAQDYFCLLMPVRRTG